MLTKDERTEESRVPQELGEEVGGRGRVYFESVVIDNILDALLELSASVWAHRDRVVVLEKVLAERGIDVSEAIEAHMPEQDELARRAKERDEFVERIFGAFLRRPTHDIGKAAETSKE